MIKIEEIDKTIDYATGIKELKSDYKEKHKDLEKKINDYFVKLPPGKYTGFSSGHHVKIRRLELIDYVYITIRDGPEYSPLDKTELKTLNTLHNDKEQILKEIYDHWVNRVKI